jgi:hypothetical protein
MAPMVTNDEPFVTLTMGCITGPLESLDASPFAPMDHDWHHFFPYIYIVPMATLARIPIPFDSFTIINIDVAFVAQNFAIVANGGNL